MPSKSPPASLPVVMHNVLLMDKSLFGRRAHSLALFARPEVICLTYEIEKPTDQNSRRDADLDQVWIREQDGRVRAIRPEEMLYPEKSGFDPELAQIASLAVLESRAYPNLSALEVLDDVALQSDKEYETASVFQMRNATVVLGEDLFDYVYQSLFDTDGPDNAQDRESYLEEWNLRLEIGLFAIPEPSSAHEHLTLSQAIKQDHADFLEVADKILSHFRQTVELRLPELPSSHEH